MSDKSKKVTALNDKVAKIMQLVEECEKLSQEIGQGFTLYIAYGMGGSYDPEEGQWNASSQSC